MAKDSKRWLLVNIQKDSEFASHALNRDVWRDELVENLVREGFIFWQTVSIDGVTAQKKHRFEGPAHKHISVAGGQFDITSEGRVYAERYKVYEFPHIGIIDPRTRRLMWKKEGWTQQNPVTAEFFAETAMDFCSRHSFDKPPQAPRPPGSLPVKRPMNEMSEDEQLKAAMRESLQDATTNDDGIENSDYEMEDDDDAVVEYVGSSRDNDLKPAAKESKEDTPKEPTLLDDLLTTVVGDEAVSGAKIQLRMPDGKRMVRQFDPSQNVKAIYAFVAVRKTMTPWRLLYACMYFIAQSHNDGLFMATTAIERRCQRGQGICAHGWLSTKGPPRRHVQHDRKLQALWTSHYDSLEVNCHMILMLVATH